MLTPVVQRAIIQSSDPGSLCLVRNRKVPEPGPSEVLIKTVAWALNPCDWKMPTNFPSPGAGVGSDYAGYIVQTGNNVHDLKVGDRVAGAVHASNPLNLQAGAFADYITVSFDQLWRIPENFTYPQAAAIGWCVVGTVGLAAYSALGLPGSAEAPAQMPLFVLVYGGSTASGTMAIQILRESGFRVITTCSPSNYKLVESYGAEKAFDYHSPNCAEEIKEYTKGSLKYAMDIIADARSIKMCYNAIGRAGGAYVGFELVPEELTAQRKVIRASWVLGIRMSGSDIALDRGYGSKADPELRAWGCRLFERMEKLFQQGRIRSHPIRLMDGGLDGVIDGVNMLKEKTVSGCKLVYTNEQ